MSRNVPSANAALKEELSTTKQDLSAMKRLVTGVLSHPSGVISLFDTGQVRNRSDGIICGPLHSARDQRSDQSFADRLYLQL